MAKIQYIDPKRMHGETKRLLGKIIPIVDDFKSQGYRMTLRQLYYQLVSQLVIPNTKGSYAKLSRILTDARMTGQVDWNFIEDRGREPIFPNEFDDIDQAMRTIVNAYRLDRWADQEYYVEVAVEKQALVGVLEPITDEYHVHLLTNKGYNSTTEMHNLAQRMQEKEDDDKKCVLLYFGDHDPSGEDMVRDIEKRLETFQTNVQVSKIALTMAQVRQYRLPPNPAKMSDPRAGEYVANHGDESWELDALRPDVLANMVRKEILKKLDKDKMDEIIALEQTHKEKMRKFGSRNKGDSED